jgi:hypothetical protein
MIPGTIGNLAILRLQEGFARVGNDRQLADKNRSMASIESSALWPQLAEGV